MPPTSRRKRQAELVELAPGATIPASFTATIPLPDERGSYTVTVRTDPASRVPMLTDFGLHFSDGVAVSAITNEQIRLLTENAIARQAQKIAARRMMAGHRVAVSDDFAEHFPDAGPVPEGVAVLDSAELQRIGDRAASTVRPRPGRRRVTDDEKLAILELYRTKGIEETVKITDRAERTVRRHIADARRIEQGRR